MSGFVTQFVASAETIRGWLSQYATASHAFVALLAFIAFIALSVPTYDVQKPGLAGMQWLASELAKTLS